MADINSVNVSNTDYVMSGVNTIISCTTAAGTASKTATVPKGFTLDSGVSFLIKFTNGNSATSPTLTLTPEGGSALTAKSLVGTFGNNLTSNIIYTCHYNGTTFDIDNNCTSHIANTSNPHSVTKTQVGLGNCDNTADANKSVSSATKLTTARTTYVTLGTSNTTTTRDWSGTTTIPVSGTLGVANGGTGATSLANITVGNSNKLGNVPVRATSIGGSTTETTLYWAYVSKSKFTTDGGYIKYSNGLLIQWGSGTTENALKNFPIAFDTACLAMTANNNRDGSFTDAVSCYFTKTQYKIRQNDHSAPTTWIAIGY